MFFSPNVCFSEGTGDLSIRASVRSLVSESFVIQDTWKYDPTTYSSNKDYNLQLPSSKYSLEFDLLKKGTSDGSAGGMVLGTDSNYFLVGCGSSTSYQVARWGTNISYVNIFSLTHNTWKTIVLEVDGGTVDIKADGNTYTVSGISSDTTSLLYKINCNNTHINIRNLKIKPL